MTQRKSLSIGLAALFACAAVSAQTPLTQKEYSLEEALQVAIERNLDIELQRVNIEASNISLQQTRTAYEPVVTNTTQTQTFDQEATNRNQGVSGQAISVETIDFNTTLSKQEDFGFSWQAQFNNNLRDSNEFFSLGETYTSTLSFGFEQKLLKGFSFDGEILRNNEFVARGNLEISEYDLQIQVANVLQQAENAYWDLVVALEKLDVTKQSLELAKQLYEQNKVKIEVGTLAPIELVNTEATIATREQELVASENAVRAAEDTLKKVLNLPPEDWTKTIKPRDRLVIEEIDLDFQKDLESAWSNRPELRKNNRQMENATLTKKLRRNELMPELNLTGGYFISGASAPVGATDEFGNPLLNENGELVVLEQSAYTDAIDKVSGFDFPGWRLALNLTWNPQNKQAKLNMAQANLDLRQREVEREQTKVNIMEEVRSANRELESNLKSIAANEKALKFRQENLKAEVQKFQNGLSTNYRVSEEQREVAAAESSLLEAKVSYMKAMVSYYKALGQLAKKRRINLN